MSPEERDELIDFILQSQANAADRHQQLADMVETLAGPPPFRRPENQS